MVMLLLTLFNHGAVIGAFASLLELSDVISFCNEYPASFDCNIGELYFAIVASVILVVLFLYEVYLHCG